MYLWISYLFEAVCRYVDPNFDKCNARKGSSSSKASAPRPSWVMQQSTLQTPFLDDCEEYVPLSQDCRPFQNTSFVGMMNDGVGDTSLVLTKIETTLPTEEKVETLDLTVEDIFDKDVVATGSKRPRVSSIMWENDVTHTLLRVYETQWLHIRKGNLCAKDWEDVTYSLNKEVDGSFNSK